MESNMNISEKLKKLLRYMRCRKVFFYFGRNHIRHTNYYYNKFIEIIGLDTWENLAPYYKHEWNSARNSFDRMNGLISAWQNMDSFPLDDPKDDFENKISILSNQIEALFEHCKEEIKEEKLQKTIKEIIEKTDELSKYLEKKPQSEKSKLEESIEILTKKITELMESVKGKCETEEKKEEKKSDLNEKSSADKEKPKSD